MTQMQQQAVAEQQRMLAAAGHRLTESEEAVTTTDTNRAGHEAYRAAQQDQHALNERMAQRRRLQEERGDVQTRLTRAETQEDAHGRAIGLTSRRRRRRPTVLAAAATEQERVGSLNCGMPNAKADRLHDAGVRIATGASRRG